MVSLARLSQAPASSLSLCECTTSTQVARSTTSSCSSPFSLPFTSYPRHRCRSSFTSLYNPTTNDASRRTYSSSHPPKGPSHNYSHLPPDLRPPEARPLRETLPKSVRQSLPFSQPLLRKQLPPIVKSQSRSTRPRPPPLLAPPLPPPPMPQLVHSPSIDLTSPLPSSYPTSIPSPFTQETWSKYSSTPPSPFEFLSASASFHTPLPSFHQFNDPLPPSRTPRSIPLPPSDPKPSSLITSASQATKSAYHSALAKLFPSPSPPPEKRKILKKEREAPELELPPVLGSPIPMIMARVVPLPKPRIQVLLEREAKEAARLASLSSSTKKSASILPPPPEAAPTSRPQTADAPSPSQSTDAPSPSSDPSYPRYPTPTHYVPPSKPRQFNRAVPPPPVAPLPTPNLRRIPRGVVYTSKGEEARAVDAKREAQEQERELERGRLEAFGFGRLVGEKKKAAVSEMEGNGKGGRKGSQAVAQVGAGMGKEKELEREREGPEASGKSRKGKALVLEGTPALSGQQKQKQKQKRKGVPGEVKELSVQPAAKGRAKGQAGAVISIDEGQRARYFARGLASMVEADVYGLRKFRSLPSTAVGGSFQLFRRMPSKLRPSPPTPPPLYRPSLHSERVTSATTPVTFRVSTGARWSS
jgi:hypothetical protein